MKLARSEIHAREGEAGFKVALKSGSERSGRQVDVVEVMLRCDKRSRKWVSGKRGGTCRRCRTNFWSHREPLWPKTGRPKPNGSLCFLIQSHAMLHPRP